MKRVTATVDEDTDLKFKKEASKKFQFERGWYSKAVNEAMEVWLNRKGPDFHIYTQNFSRDIGSYLWKNLKERTDIGHLEPQEYMDILIEFLYGENSAISYEIRDDDIIIYFPDKIEPDNPEYQISQMHQLITLVRAAQEDHKGVKYNIRGIEKIEKIVITKD